MNHRDSRIEGGERRKKEGRRGNFIVNALGDGGGVGKRRTTAYYSARQKWCDPNFNKEEEPYKGPNYGRKGLRSKYRSLILLLRRRRKYELGGSRQGR